MWSWEGPELSVIGGGFKRGSSGEDLSAGCDTGTNSADRWRPLGVESSLDDKWPACVFVCKIECQTIFTYHWVRSFLEFALDIQPGTHSLLSLVSCFAPASLSSHLSLFSLILTSTASPPHLSNPSLPSPPLLQRSQQYLPSLSASHITLPDKRGEGPDWQEPQINLQAMMPFLGWWNSLYTIWRDREWRLGASTGDGVRLCYLCNYRERPWSFSVSFCLPWSK